jgi:hypothetical protein
MAQNPQPPSPDPSQTSTAQPPGASSANTKQIVKQLYDFAAAKIRAGSGREATINALMQKGLDRGNSVIIVDRLLAVRQEALRSRAGRDVLVGALVCVAGIIITVVTYSAAAHSSSGGTYVVAWGAIIFGAIQFFRGLSHLG